MQKSIIELQSIATFFNYRLFSLVLVPAIAKLTLIKEHSHFFFIFDKQNGRNHGHRETMFESMHCH